MSNPQPPPAGAPPINIEFPANLPTQYANFALIMHTPGEIIVNFASIMPQAIGVRPVNSPIDNRMILELLSKKKRG